MAQKIKIRRGSIDNIGSTIAVAQGELLYASGSTNGVEHVVFIANADGNNTFTPVSKLYQGTSAATSFASVLNGIQYHNTSDKAIYILNSSNSPRLDLTGNIAGKIISGSLTITGSLSVENSISASGNITGSNLYLSGNANIIGNLVLGGNITVGDSTSDSVAFGAEISSSVIPDVNNAFDLGSGAKAWKDLHVSGTAYIQSLTNVNTTLTGNLTVSGSTFLGDTTADKVNITGSLNVSGSTNFNNGNVLVAEDLAVNGGDITTSAAIFNLINTVATTLNIGGGATSAVNIGNASGTVTVAGPTSLSSTLVVTGASNLSSTLVVTGSTTLSSSLGVTGATTLSSTLGVTGASNLSSTLVVTGSTTLSSSLGVIGIATINNTTNSTSYNSGALQVAGGVGIGKDLYVSGSTFITGNLTLLGAATSLVISSSTIELDDNIIRLNAFSPFQRYAGIEVIDSGSTSTSASLLWDSSGDYWILVSGSASGSKLIGTTLAAQGSEVSLTANTIPKATYSNTVGDSLLTDNATTLAYNTSKFTVEASSGNTSVAGTLTVTGSAILSSSLSVVGNITLDKSGAQNITHSGTGNLTISSTSGNVLIEGSTFNGDTLTVPANVTAVSFTSSAFTATTFLKSDASKGIASVSITDTSGSADVYFVYSAASGFFATSVVDGGTY